MPGLAGIVAAMFLAQVYSAIVFNGPAVWAPTVTRELGIAPQAIGLHFAIGSVAGVLVSFLLGGTIYRYGPLRVIQAVILLGGLGMLIAASGALGALAVASFLGGTIGGLAIPAAAVIFSRTVPPERFGIVFSLKQAGAPIGIAIAGTGIPAMLLVMSWQTSFVVVGAAGVLVALMLQPLRSRLDRERNPNAPLRRGALLEPLLIVLREPRLRRLSIGAALACVVQMALISYLVSYLNLELGYSLLAAGAALTASQISSMFARLVWGALMDRLGSPLRVLGYGAIASAVLGAAGALIESDWPYAGMLIIVVLFSIAATGWNGVFLGGMARFASPGTLVSATAGGQFFLYVATVVGPLAFAAIVSLAGSYRPAFLAFAGMSLASGIWILRSARAHAA